MWCGPGVGAGDRSGDHWQCGGTTEHHWSTGARTWPRSGSRPAVGTEHTRNTAASPAPDTPQPQPQTVASWGPVPLNICQLTKVWRHNKNRLRKTLFTVSLSYLAPSRSTHCHVIKARKENIFSFYSVNKKAHRK